MIFFNFKHLFDIFSLKHGYSVLRHVVQSARNIMLSTIVPSINRETTLREGFSDLQVFVL